MRRYTLILREDREQGGYWVDVPTLPGVYSYGETRDEAVAKGREAIEGYIKVLQEHGEPIPEEQSKPEIVSVEVAA